jgi:hypothetical protein
MIDQNIGRPLEKYSPIDALELWYSQFSWVLLKFLEIFAVEVGQLELMTVTSRRDAALHAPERAHAHHRVAPSVPRRSGPPRHPRPSRASRGLACPDAPWVLHPPRVAIPRAPRRSPSRRPPVEHPRPNVPGRTPPVRLLCRREGTLLLLTPAHLSIKGTTASPSRERVEAARLPATACAISAIDGQLLPSLVSYAIRTLRHLH